MLFTGTGSVDRNLEAVGFQVDNLDLDPKCNATWTCDVLDWEAYRDMEPGTTTSSGPHRPARTSLLRARERRPRETWKGPTGSCGRRSTLSLTSSRSGG